MEIDLARDIPPGVLARVLRDPRESPAKCSLTPLRTRKEIEFLNFRIEDEYRAGGLLLLHHDAPPLSPRDRGRPLLLIDASWRRLEVILRRVRGAPLVRSIPPDYRTAYPRRSRDYEDPAAGLASIEALFVALCILERRDDTLLDGYHWSDAFLAANAAKLPVV